MKIVVCEFRQESNSFNPVNAKWKDFQRCGIYENEEMRRALEGKPCAVNGMFCAIQAAGENCIPTISMNGNSGGIVDQSVVDYFLEKAVSALRKELPVDGVFVSLHGATQSTKWEDVCGEILSVLRQTVGSSAVIAISCDLHANVTEKMWEMADIICGYHTYPHVDFFETGYRAAELGIRALRGEKLQKSRVELPMIVTASSYTTLRGEFSKLMEEGKQMVENDEIQDFSIFQMQPWLDVSCGRSTVVAIGHKAQECANYLAERLWTLRHTFHAPLYTVSQICRIAKENTTGRPIILVDASDSTNAGACGDSAFVLKEILTKYPTLKSAFYLNDPRLVEEAFAAGVGAKRQLVIGGSISGSENVSVISTAVVRSLHDGKYILEGPASKGMPCNIGKTAVLTVKNTDIVVCQAISAPGDPQIYRYNGIEPENYQLVVVKACTSYRAAYEKIAAGIYEADTIGAAAVNLDRLTFTHIPTAFFHFANHSLDAEAPQLLAVKQSSAAEGNAEWNSMS